MEAQPEAEPEVNAYNPTYVLDSEDSEEDSCQEEPAPVTSWSELSIIERVGLNSAEMSEGDLETAYCQISLAFRCDQYTLKQRLQAEEHARNLAEENVQLELSRGRETLESLKALCMDSKRSHVLQKLELSLDILAGTVERISNTAEVLGAVHQEARVSRAVELMVAHVENLKRRHERNLAELEEAKNDPRGSPDIEDGDRRRKSFQQFSSRRRVSMSLIPLGIQTKEKKKRDVKKRKARGGSPPDPSASVSSESSGCATTKDDKSPTDPDEAPDEAPHEAPSEAADAQPSPPQPSPSPVPDPECLPETLPESLPAKKPLVPRKMLSKPHPLDTLRQRHKGKAALSKKKADKDKKSLNNYRRPSENRYEDLWKRPPAHWLQQRRWPLLCTYLFVLLCVSILTYVLFEAL